MTAWTRCQGALPLAIPPAPCAGSRRPIPASPNDTAPPPSASRPSGHQVAEEPGGIAGVGLRIEGRFQAGEGIRVVHQVHLRTADVDRPHSSRLHVAHSRHRLRLGIIEIALALGIAVHGQGCSRRSPGRAGRSLPGRSPQAGARNPTARSAAATAGATQQALRDRRRGLGAADAAGGQREQQQRPEARWRMCRRISTEISRSLAAIPGVCASNAALRKIACRRTTIPYIVHRSNAAPGRAVCFLGRFLPKLGGATSAAIFLPMRRRVRRRNQARGKRRR